MLGSREYGQISKDLDEAIRTHSLPASESIYPNLIDHYSLRARIEFSAGRNREALDDLDTVMKMDLDSADRVSNIEGVEAEKTSKPCVWNLTDLDTLVTKFPRDYQPALLLGIYFKFFTTFKEDYYPKALQEFQKATLLNPKSPLPQYFIGQLYSKASFWTKAAWASDEGRNGPYRRAIAAYTKAIQLDPNFRLAYAERASAYHGLKQYPQAIKDYDRVLDLDPENVTAYNDRGLARMEIGQYPSANLDFGDAIRRKDEQATTLGMSYQNRGDAYVWAERKQFWRKEQQRCTGRNFREYISAGLRG